MTVVASPHSGATSRQLACSGCPAAAAAARGFTTKQTPQLASEGFVEIKQRESDGVRSVATQSRWCRRSCWLRRLNFRCPPVRLRRCKCEQHVQVTANTGSCCSLPLISTIITTTIPPAVGLTHLGVEAGPHPQLVRSGGAAEQQLQD